MSVIHRAAAAAVAAGMTAAAGLAMAPAAGAVAHSQPSFIGHFHKLKTIGSTVPRNGDVNPYGTVLIRHNRGRLRRGNVLISNFNNKANLQGTGTTIVQVGPGGRRHRFAHITAAKLGANSCPGGIGLTTALALVHGWVVVGSLPTTNGMSPTAKAGCLIVLDSHGRVRETFAGHGINGPWDMTSAHLGRRHSDLFVTNVLNGTVAAGGKVVLRGTVLRLTLGFRRHHAPRLLATTRIGSGFAEHTDPGALVVGPTGVGLSGGTLYVADSSSNRVAAIPAALVRLTSAGPGLTVTRNGALNTPLGLTIAPNGDVLTVNGGNGKLIEITPGGAQIATRQLDSSGSPPGAGALFGLVVKRHGRGVYYVDDATNTLRLLH